MVRGAVFRGGGWLWALGLGLSQVVVADQPLDDALGLCNRFGHRATSTHLGFLHPPTLDIALNPIGNSPIFTHRIDQLTKIPDNSAQKRARHQVILPYSCTRCTTLRHFLRPRVIDPNKFPFGRLVDVRSSYTSLDWQESNQCRRTSFAQLSAMTVVDSM